MTTVDLTHDQRQIQRFNDLCASVEYLELALDAAIDGPSLRRVVVFDFHDGDGDDDERELVDRLRTRLHDAGPRSHLVVDPQHPASAVEEAVDLIKEYLPSRLISGKEVVGARQRDEVGVLDGGSQLLRALVGHALVVP
jgi:hypothetical protein